MPGIDPLSAGLGGLGIVGNFFGGRSAQQASKEMLRRQAQYASMANQTYKAAQPTYQALLQQLAGAAGIGPGAVQQDQYGLNPQDQMRLRMADEDIAHRQQLQGNQLRFQLGQRGIASGSIGAALGRNVQQGNQEYANFRRGLFVNAPNVQQQRLAALQAALGPAFGQGSQAASIYGSQGQYQGNQANQAFAGIGNIAQQLMYQNQLGGSPYGMYGYGGYGGGYTPQLPTGYFGAEQAAINPYGQDYRPKPAPILGQGGYSSRF